MQWKGVPDMAIEVFNRYEKKYMMDEKTFFELTDRISDYMNPDEIGRAHV